MAQETKSFISYGQANSGLIFDESKHKKYPLKYFNIINGQGATFKNDLSYFVFIYSGEANLEIENGIKSILPKDTYFSHHGSFSLSGEFKAIAIEIYVYKGEFSKNKYKSVTHIGGVVEEIGRLKYIDGCTDSLLIPPVKKGDPCLNHLHFPNNIIQTPHTHPSHRIGLVIRGEGECDTPFGKLPLYEGVIFVIKEYDGEEKAEGLDGLLYEAGTHKFNTYTSSMDVIAFHPDSDFGPEDEFHPMINRTIVEGVPAKDIDSIRTK
jgi:hypothetical protein